MRYAWWNTIIASVSNNFNECVILIVGGCEKITPYPNVGYRFE